MNTPVEVLETAYPLRVRRYAYRPDSGGPGEHRGGLGLRRDIQVRGHVARFSLLADRQEHPPYGIAGGDAGTCGAAYVHDADSYDADGEDATAGDRLPQKTVRDLDPGAVVSVLTPGAGGFGDPAARDPEAVRRDLELGKVTEAFVRQHYGRAPPDAGEDDD
jgi:N-methylhydantoinase B